MKIDLEHWQVRTLVTALEMTERAYEKYADNMEQCALASGNDFLSAKDCRVIKKQHERNAAATRVMIDLLDGNLGVSVEVPAKKKAQGFSTHRASWMDERNGDVIPFNLVVSWDGDICVLEDVTSVDGASCTDVDRIPDDYIEDVRRGIEFANSTPANSGTMPSPPDLAADRF